MKKKIVNLLINFTWGIPATLLIGSLVLLRLNLNYTYTISSQKNYCLNVFLAVIFVSLFYFFWSFIIDKFLPKKQIKFLSKFLSLLTVFPILFFISYIPSSFSSFYAGFYGKILILGTILLILSPFTYYVGAWINRKLKISLKSAQGVFIVLSLFITIVIIPVIYEEFILKAIFIAISLLFGSFGFWSKKKYVNIISIIIFAILIFLIFSGEYLCLFHDSRYSI